MYMGYEINHIKRYLLYVTQRSRGEGGIEKILTYKKMNKKV